MSNERPEGDWYEDFWSDGTRTFHAHEGTVFIRKAHNSDQYYIDIETDRGLYEDVRAGVMGIETNAFSNALVRRKGRAEGFFTGYVYYPLPLIFASPEERRIAAEALGKRPPPERWARRRREEIEKLFNMKKRA